MSELSALVFVNSRSRARVHSVRAFAALVASIAAAFVLGAAPGLAYAERVVVLGATGDADEDTLIEISVAIGEAARELAFHTVSESGTLDADEHTVPEEANELRAIAEFSGAEWVVVPIVHDVSDDAYWVTLRVGYAPETRVEELDAEVRRSRVQPRFVELLRALLSLDGVSDEDAGRLGGVDQAARDEEARAAEVAAAEAERQAREEAEREAAEAEAAEAERLAREQAERDGFTERERDGAGAPWMLAGGFGVHGLLRSAGEGGALGTLEVRVGRALGATGLELRAGVDAVFGAAGGFSLQVGAAYLFTPTRHPLHLGAALDVGLFQALTGNQVPSFLTRVGALVVYRVTRSLYLEAELPEVTVLSANGGVVSLGASVRVGTRF